MENDVPGKPSSLVNTLVSRATALPTKPQNMPPQWERFMMGEMMKHAYANNWQPNPIVMRVLGDKITQHMGGGGSKPQK